MNISRSTYYRQRRKALQLAARAVDRPVFQVATNANLGQNEPEIDGYLCGISDGNEII
jgi:hypothetical protein